MFPKNCLVLEKLWQNIFKSGTNFNQGSTGTILSIFWNIICQERLWDFLHSSPMAPTFTKSLWTNRNHDKYSPNNELVSKNNELPSYNNENLCHMGLSSSHLGELWEYSNLEISLTWNRSLLYLNLLTLSCRILCHGSQLRGYHIITVEAVERWKSVHYWMLPCMSFLSLHLEISLWMDSFFLFLWRDLYVLTWAPFICIQTYNHRFN